MSTQDRDRWNTRYREGAYATRQHPSDILTEWAPRVMAATRARTPPAVPRALDVACGAGRNALWLAAAGFAVDAVDIADAGLALARRRAAELGLDVDWVACDLDAGLPAARAGYDLIVVIRYLNRDLLRALSGRLTPGGYLVCEVHLETDQPVVGPATPAFRVAPGELATLVPGLEVEVLDEGLVTDPDGRPAALARLVGRRPQA